MEIEAKFLLQDTKEIESYLSNLSNPKNLQILDIYFDDEKFSLLKNYEAAFRIRKENEKFYITIKRKLNSNEILFKRQEHEFEVDGELFKKLRASQFYFCFKDIRLIIFPQVEIFSKRQLFIVENLKISIDRVFFNNDTIMDFLEIEGDEIKVLNFIDILSKKFKLNSCKLSKLETYLNMI